jgi:hypothetical protein
MNQRKHGFFVASNRQKAPENGFQKRARLKREAEEERAESRAARIGPGEPPPYPPRPAIPPIPSVDLEAMKTAAAEAAALVLGSAPVDELTERLQGAGTLEVPDSMTIDGIEEHTETLEEAVTEVVAEPEQAKRGRPMSAAVMKRNATILQLLAENPEGLSKPQLATELQEKEANVYTSLRRLQSDGKVRTENTEGTKYLWYLV